MANKSTSPKAGKQRPRWIRIAWRIARALIVPILCIGALIAGLVIGYEKLGGQEASDIFRIATWKHLIDLVFAD